MTGEVSDGPRRELCPVRPVTDKGEDVSSTRGPSAQSAYGRECVWVTGELPNHGIKVIAPVYNHRTPTEDEITRIQALLLHAANSRSNGAHWPWVSLAIIAETGARVGTIEKLRVWDFDPEGARLTLQGKVTEKLPDGRRTIPIDGLLVNTLRQWLLRCGRPDPDERLVGVKGKLVRSRGRDKLVAACNELGIKQFTWHGVRRRVVLLRLRRQGVCDGRSGVPGPLAVGDAPPVRRDRRRRRPRRRDGEGVEVPRRMTWPREAPE